MDGLPWDTPVVFWSNVWPEVHINRSLQLTAFLSIIWDVNYSYRNQHRLELTFNLYSTMWRPHLEYNFCWNNFGRGFNPKIPPPDYATEWIKQMYIVSYFDYTWVQAIYSVQQNWVNIGCTPCSHQIYVKKFNKKK